MWLKYCGSYTLAFMNSLDWCLNSEIKFKSKQEYNNVRIINVCVYIYTHTNSRKHNWEDEKSYIYTPTELIVCKEHSGYWGANWPGVGWLAIVFDSLHLPLSAHGEQLWHGQANMKIMSVT